MFGFFSYFYFYFCFKFIYFFLTLLLFKIKFYVAFVLFYQFCLFLALKMGVFRLVSFRFFWFCFFVGCRLSFIYSPENVRIVWNIVWQSFELYVNWNSFTSRWVLTLVLRLCVTSVNQLTNQLFKCFLKHYVSQKWSWQNSKVVWSLKV